MDEWVDTLRTLSLVTGLPASPLEVRSRQFHHRAFPLGGGRG